MEVCGWMKKTINGDGTFIREKRMTIFGIWYLQFPASHEARS
jgi:hypothetical protein